MELVSLETGRAAFESHAAVVDFVRNRLSKELGYRPLTKLATLGAY
jgi:hypothetical protein